MDGTLNQYLQPLNAPVTQPDLSELGINFDLNTDRNIIGATKLKDFSFNSGIGGTITLGGTANGNGYLQIEDASGNVIVTGDNLGNHYFNTSGTEVVKVDSGGFHSYDTSHNLLTQVDTIGFHAYNTSANELIRVDNTGLHEYDTSGSTKVELVSGGLFAYGNNGAQIQFKTQSSDSTSKGVLGLDGAGDFIIASNNSNDAKLSAKNALTLAALSAGIQMTSNQDITLSYGGNFKLNGTTKTAIVPTSQGYKALYCTESPEVWFMDFARIERSWKFWKKPKILVDKTFLEITEAPYITMPTLDKNIVQVWGKRKGFKDTRFESKTQEEFDRNNVFWSQVDTKESK